MFSFFNRRAAVVSKTPSIIVNRPGAQGPKGNKGDMPTYRAPKFTRADNEHASANRPRRVHSDDAGYDLELATATPVTILPSHVVTVPVGYSVRLDPATVGLVLPRSGMASKRGIVAITGVIDAGYTGELKVTLHNTSRVKVTLMPGTRIAQLVVTPFVSGDKSEVAKKSTKRGGAGFGSTDNTPVGVLPTKTPDMVNRPPHYTVHSVFSGECHEYAKYMTFDQGNAFKYLWRCASKDDMTENINKALWYLKAMSNGPVLYRRGNVLDYGRRNRLEREVSEAMDATDKDTAPNKFMSALACYSAAALIAQGEIDAATILVNDALQRLNDTPASK